MEETFLTMSLLVSRYGKQKDRNPLFLSDIDFPTLFEPLTGFVWRRNNSVVSIL